MVSAYLWETYAATMLGNHEGPYSPYFPNAYVAETMRGSLFPLFPLLVVTMVSQDVANKQETMRESLFPLFCFQVQWINAFQWGPDFTQYPYIYIYHRFCRFQMSTSHWFPGGQCQSHNQQSDFKMLSMLIPAPSKNIAPIRATKWIDPGIPKC